MAEKVYTGGTSPVRYRDTGVPVSQEAVDEALTVLIAHTGNSQTASAYLDAKLDIRISPEELEHWRLIFRDRFHQIAERLGPKLEEDIIREAREVAGRAMVLERKLLEETERQIANGKITDPARAAASISRVKQSAIEKLLSLTGRPERITEHRTADEVIRGLEAMGVVVSDAEEVVDRND